MQGSNVSEQMGAPSMVLDEANVSNTTGCFSSNVRFLCMSILVPVLSPASIYALLGHSAGNVRVFYANPLCQCRLLYKLVWASVLTSLSGRNPRGGRYCKMSQEF